MNRNRLATAAIACLVAAVAVAVVGMLVSLNQRTGERSLINQAARDALELDRLNAYCSNEEAEWKKLGTSIYEVLSKPTDIDSDPQQFFKHIQNQFALRDKQTFVVENSRAAYLLTAQRNNSTRSLFWNFSGIASGLGGVLLLIHWLSAPGNKTAISGNIVNH